MPLESILLALVMVIVMLAIVLFVVLIVSGFNPHRILLALRSEVHLLRDDAFGAKVQAILDGAEVPAPSKKPSGAALRLLTLLQREGRLLDFLLEDIQTYGDAQIGAAVRDIHQKCQATLKEHLALEPILTQPEGASVEVPAGFDPSAIRLTGNVTGQPPFHGTLQHHGWRVKELKLAPVAQGQDEFVVMPAEVELA